MSWFAAPGYWFARLVFERGLAAIYMIAFTAAACQFRGLLGSRGLLPVPRYLNQVSFRQKPSLFHLRYSDRLFAVVAWSGAALAAAMAGGLADAVPLWGAMLGWLALWGLYLSIANVGQAWYAFGWESLLLEAGFLAVFLGNSRSPPPVAPGDPQPQPPVAPPRFDGERVGRQAGQRLPGEIVGALPGRVRGGAARPAYEHPGMPPRQAGQFAEGLHGGHRRPCHWDCLSAFGLAGWAGRPCGGGNDGGPCVAGRTSAGRCASPDSGRSWPAPRPPSAGSAPSRNSASRARMTWTTAGRPACARS
jgi:hypothetical protein